MKPQQLTILGVVGTLVILLGALAVLVFKVSNETRVSPHDPVENTGRTEDNLKKFNTFNIITPARVKAGEDFTITIMAVDSRNKVVTSYTGIILIKSDLILIPDRSRFLPGDLGRHKFKVRAKGPGTDIIEVTDSGTNLKVESKPIIIDEADPLHKPEQPLWP